MTYTIVAIVANAVVLLLSSVLSYYIGYRAGVEASAKRYAQQFAKGMRQWLVKDFMENGKNDL